mmetsp:Transcript_13481/g.32679  ORF Transcript_13481/g.32679 Transcript_13481/m.32679 type:complete len:266 (-) Transcript_13481:397-1194(-)
MAHDRRLRQHTHSREHAGLRPRIRLSPREDQHWRFGRVPLLLLGFVRQPDQRQVPRYVRLQQGLFREDPGHRRIGTGPASPENRGQVGPTLQRRPGCRIRRPEFHRPGKSLQQSSLLRRVQQKTQNAVRWRNEDARSPRYGQQRTLHEGAVHLVRDGHHRGQKGRAHRPLPGGVHARSHPRIPRRNGWDVRLHRPASPLLLHPFPRLAVGVVPSHVRHRHGVRRRVGRRDLLGGGYHKWGDRVLAVHFRGGIEVSWEQDDRSLRR